MSFGNQKLRKHDACLVMLAAVVASLVSCGLIFGLYLLNSHYCNTLWH